MKALVTGGGGQLARALVATRPEAAQIVPLERACLDVTDAGAVDAALAAGAPDVVINCAAYTAVDKAEEEPAEANRINGEAAGLLAEAAQRHGARFIQLSTDFVFAGDSGRPIRPDDPPHPLNAYGRSKRTGEERALAVADSLVVRTAWLYGVGGHNFVASMLQRMVHGQHLRVVADQVGTPTHTVSLAAALWKLAAGGARGVVHFTDAGVASWYDFAVAIQEEALAAGLLDKAVTITPIASSEYPTPARRPAFSVLEKSATWELLGGPARHWRVELRAMLSALKDERAS